MTDEFERGNSIKIDVEFKDSAGNYIDPTSPVIKVDRYDDESIVTETGLTKEQAGRYYYYWDTTEALEVADYYITTKGTVSEHTLLDRVKVALVKTE